MKKVFITVHTIILFACNAYAQDTWFKIIDPQIGLDQRVAIIKEFGAFYIQVFGVRDSIPLTSNAVMKFDLKGAHQWTLLCKYPSTSDTLVHLDMNLIIAKDSSIYFQSTAYAWNAPLSILLNKITPQGELVWDKIIGHENETLYAHWMGIGLNPDSMGFSLVRTTPNHDMVLFNFDSSGTVQWKKQFPPLTNYQVSYHIPMAIFPDSTIFLAYDNSILLWQKQEYLARLDAYANPEMFVAYPNNDKPIDLARHPNGNLVYQSHRVNPNENGLPGDPDPYGGMRVQMLTPDLDTIWSYLYQDLYLPYICFKGSTGLNLSIAPDGKILACAANLSCIHLACFSPEGVLLWSRQIGMQDHIEPGFTQEYFQTAIWTSEGGILVGGYITGTFDYPIGYKTKIFLLKLDSVGCLQPGCSETILTSAVEAPSLADDCWQVSPNPAGAMLHVQLAPDCNVRALLTRLQLFDAQGRMVLEQAIPPGQSAWYVPTAHLASGVYFLQAGDEQFMRLSKKVVVQQ